MLTYSAPDEGLTHNLDLLVRVALAVDQPMQMRLYTNDLVPLRTTTFADYVEATFLGYTRRTLNRAAWSAPWIDADHVARIKLAGGPQVYNLAAVPETIYGVYIVDPALELVWFARRFAVPRVLEVGDTLAVNPIITLASQVYEVTT